MKSSLLTLLSLFLLLPSLRSVTASESVEPYLSPYASPAGFASVVNFGDSDLPLQIAQNSQFIVHAIDPDPKAVAALRAKAVQAGLLGIRLYVEQMPAAPLPYADHLVDLLVVANPDPALSEQEVSRVLTPIRGRAFAGGHEIMRKPALPGAENWSHPLRGPHNNPASNDTAFTGDPIIQYLAYPMQNSFQGSMLAADGIRIELTDWVTKKNDRAAVAGKLIGRSLYNGRMLWQRALPPNIEPDTPLVALDDNRIYLADGENPQVLVIDARTGGDLGTLPISEDPQVRVRWLAVEQGRLYTLTGPALPTRPAFVFLGGKKNQDMRKAHANEGGAQLQAWDLASGAPAWTYTPDSPVDYRSVATRDGRVYYASDTRLAALDANGKVTWENSALFKEADRVKRARGYNVNTEAVSRLVVGPAGQLAFSLEDAKGTYIIDTETGQKLWELPIKGPKNFFIGDKLYSPRGIMDATTGDRVADAGFEGKGCGITTWIPGMDTGLGHVALGVKSPCGVGSFATGGMVIFASSQCDCWPFQRGNAAFASGGETLRQARETPQHPLQAGNAPAPTLQPAPGDWPTYRGSLNRQGAASIPAGSSATLAWQSPAIQPYAVPEGHGQQRLEWLERPTAPVTAGGLVFSAGSDGLIRAVRIADGQQAWAYPTGGAVLTSPTVAGGRLFAGSADGWIYCLDAATGELAWRWRGAPMERRIVVYDKLMSSWPLTALLADGDTVYGVAGHWMQNGSLTFALDAATGQPKWTTWTDPTYDIATYTEREDYGFSPSGQLALVKGNLWVRSYLGVPGVFDPATGARVPADPLLASLQKSGWAFGLRHANGGGELIRVGDEFVLQGGRPLLFNPDMRNDKTAGRYNAHYLTENGHQAVTPLTTTAIPDSMPAPALDNERIAFAGGVGSTSFRARQPTAGISLWSLEGWQEHFESGRNEGTTDDPDAADPDAGPQRKGRANANLPDLRSGARYALDFTLAGWRQQAPDVSAIALAPEAVVIAAGKQVSQRNEPVRFEDWALEAYDADSGTKRWSAPLPKEPMMDAIAPTAEGRWLVTLRDGSIACFEVE